MRNPLNKRIPREIRIEDGNLELPAEADDTVRDAIESEGVTLYENLFKDEKSVNDSKLRLFKVRTEVNIICLLDGSMPQTDSEIVLDRLYMKANNIRIGDSIQVSDLSYKVVGIVALVSVALDALWRGMMMEYPGWLSPVIPTSAYVKTILTAAATYFVTAFILKKKINRIPMDEALKNTE